MPRTYTLRQRLRYRFDNALSRGLWAVLLWLGGIALLFVLLVAALIAFSGIGPGDAPASFNDGLWLALTRSLDSGTFTGDEGGRFRLFMLVVTIIGLFLGAAIIGLVSSSIDSRVEALRRGKSIVVESGHTLVIGHSDKLPAIVGELVEANLSERNRAIVVLSPDDTVEVTEHVRGTVRDMKTSRLVVRSGSPTRIPDLAQANPGSAKSVIILRAPDESDAHVVKTVLALVRIVPELQDLTVVAEMDDPATAAALTQAVGGNLITVIPNEIIARISAQVSRASGLGVVFQELLDFEGDEIYSIALADTWHGRSFGELLMSSSSSTIVGLRRSGGAAQLCPPPDTILAAGDFAIGISEDDSTFVLDRDPVDWHAPDERRWADVDEHLERTLMIGWSPLAPLIASEIEVHVTEGSELHVLVSPGAGAQEAVEGSLDLTRQSVHVHLGDPINRKHIDRVLGHGPFDHVLLLCERKRYSLDEADARTLLTLMLVREATKGGSENILTELLEPNAVDLGGTASGGDFIVSQKLISLLMTQLSESPHLADVFADLLDSDGVRVALHPPERYVPLGQTTFGGLVEAAREWGVVAIGYRAEAALADPSAMAGGVRVNPPKDTVVMLAEDDRVIVISPN
jgi:voltage-gated potassium channel Kch